MNNFADTSLVYFKSKEDDTLEALAFYEGSHIDSQGNSHLVPPETIKALAEKSNELLTQTDIPILTEHTKSPDNIRGIIKDANSFIARPIDASDVQRNPKLSSALGKLGLFVSNIKLTDEKLLNNIRNGIGKAISLGIDFKNQLVRELSFVTVPALNLASVFNSNSELTYLIADTKSKSNKALTTNFNMETTAVTLEEALQTNEDDEQLKSETIELLCTFLAVVENITSMSDEDLGNYQVASKEELYQSQLEAFMMMLDEKINPFNQETLDQEQGQIDPRMQPQQAQYNYPLAITTFDEMDQYISEYGLGSMLKVAGSGIKAGLKGGLAGAKTNRAGVTGIGNKIKKSATGFLKGSGIATKAANVANKGLGKLSAGMAKSASATGNVDRMNASRVINEARKKLVNKRRASGFNSSSKLSKFIK